MGTSARGKAYDGSDSCGNWNCGMVHEDIDKSHDDWRIACRSTEAYRKVHEFRNEERRKLRETAEMTGDGQ